MAFVKTVGFPDSPRGEKVYCPYAKQAVRKCNHEQREEGRSRFNLPLRRAAVQERTVIGEGSWQGPKV